MHSSKMKIKTFSQWFYTGKYVKEVDVLNQNFHQMLELYQKDFLLFRFTTEQFFYNCNSCWEYASYKISAKKSTLKFSARKLAASIFTIDNGCIFFYNQTNGNFLSLLIKIFFFVEFPIGGLSCVCIKYTKYVLTIKTLLKKLYLTNHLTLSILKWSTLNIKG